MKIGHYYSHHNGFEWIQYHQKDVWDEGKISNDSTWSDLAVCGPEILFAS